jgi:hypothetical protein
MAPARYGLLQIDEDLAFQQQEWRAAHVLWWVTLGAIVLASLGGFGHGGPLSGRDAREGTLRVTYAAFARRDAGTDLRIDAGGANEVAISRAFLDGFRLVAITPAPLEAIAAGEEVVLRFATRPPGAKLQVTFALLPVAVGRRTGWLSVADGSRVALRQFVFP